jgi:hypothetical protein
VWLKNSTILLRCRYGGKTEYNTVLIKLQLVTYFVPRIIPGSLLCPPPPLPTPPATLSSNRQQRLQDPYRTLKSLKLTKLTTVLLQYYYSTTNGGRSFLSGCGRGSPRRVHRPSRAKEASKLFKIRRWDSSERWNRA